MMPISTSSAVKMEPGERLYEKSSWPNTTAVTRRAMLIRQMLLLSSACVKLHSS